MDGQVIANNRIVSPAEDIEDAEGNESEGDDPVRHPHLDMADFHSDYEQMRMLDDDTEQPDGQRSSLGLDDDGGTHFEFHSQETVIRKGGAARGDVNVVSPSVLEKSDDNDVIFSPTQKLDYDEEEEDEDVGNRDNVDEMPGSVMDNANTGERNYMFDRPLVNGSDMAEGGTRSVALTAHDQGQNIRIIEGHDSSLLDNGGNSAFGFNLLQAQMIQLPLMSSLTSGLGNHNRSEEEALNLYDSLEREDGSSPYGESHEQSLDNNNTSEYFSSGSVSLVVANSQGQDNDTLWAQEDTSDHGSYLSHPQQHFHTIHNMERNSARHQSPPRNFQVVDASNMFGLKRCADGFIGDSNAGSCGDVHNAEEDNTDVLSLELSEEGLSRNTQLYAQPLSSSGTMTVGTVTGISAERGDIGITHQHLQGESSSNRLAVNNNNQNGVYDNLVNKSSQQGMSNSQPKNLAWNQNSLSKDELVVNSHVEGDGVTQQYERQAGAGSSSTTDQKPAGDNGRLVKKASNSKIQIRRPAVQGSASSNDSKKSVGVNPHLSTSGPLKKTATTLPLRSVSQGDTNVRSNATASNLKIGGESVKGNSSGVPQSRQPQGQASVLGSHLLRASQNSNINSTISRVSGVGKESYMIPIAQAGVTRGACQLIVGTESNPPSFPGQRQDNGKSETVPATNHNTSHVGGSTGTGLAHQSSLMFDRGARGLANQQSPDHPHSSQSFTKHRGTLQLPQQNAHGQGDHSSDSQRGDQHLPPRPDNQHRRTVGGNGGGNDSGAQQQQHNPQIIPHSQHLPFGNQPLTLQRSHSGFPIQPGFSQATSPSGSEGNPQSFNRDAVATQMEVLKRHGKKILLSEPSHLNNLHPGHLEHDIQGMEEVRSHLHSMLRMGVETSTMKSDYTSPDADTASELLLSEPPVNRQLYFDTDSSSFMGNNPPDDMSEIFENFPTFSSKIFSEMSGLYSRSDTMAHGESNYLRGSLEKERSRRKHCEEQIQRLNAKLLEVQQQLAVAVSTDKRKDLMIEQLDKQLAKVVEGWKKRETEKDEFLKVLNQEKEQIEETLKSQQAMINSFERDLSQTVGQLREEKEMSAQKISNLKDELYKVERAKEQVEELLSAERVKFSEMTTEWVDLRESRELAEKRAVQAQERLVEEQDAWSKKERELLAKINEVKEANQKVINMEKVKLEEQKKRREEAEAHAEDLKTELKKVVLDMEQLIREKENQKVEMAIMEAKFESAQRKLEADLHAQMEKEIADQASEFHSRIEVSLEEASERHHKQVAELHNRHQRDLGRQTTLLQDERQKKEEEYKKQITELEEKLQELRNENTTLRQSKIKLESQRMEILTKLQFMMQSQWNEAVSLLVSTPHKKGLNGSFISSQSGSQLASAVAVTDGNTSVTSLNVVTSGLAVTSSQTNESGGHEASQTSPPPQPPLPAAVENGGSERHEEMDRMNRVEEYLQRLSNHLDIPMTRNDLQIMELDQGNTRPTTSTAPTTATDNIGQSHISAILKHQQQMQYSNQQYLATHDQGNDFSSKPSNNLNLSQLPSVHSCVTSQSDKSLMPVSGHRIGVEPRFQAVPMRSPQQSSSQFNSDTSYPSLRGGFESQPPFSSNPYLLNSHTSQSPESSLQQHHPQLYQEQQQQLLPLSQYVSPHHPSRVRFSDETANVDKRSAAGDCGDHKDMKLSTGAANINLYSPQSPTFTPSPALFNVDQGSSPRSWLGPGCFIATAGAAAAATTGSSSPNRGSSRRFLDVMDSPVKKHRPKLAHQLARNNDRLNESLSPPVKQTAEKDHPDSLSESSSVFHDPNRLQTNYSHLSDQMDEHQSRQEELQHYVRMLLQKAPGSVCSEPERDVHSDHEILESSRDLTVDLDLNDTATAVELTSQLTRLQQLREQHQRLREQSTHNQNPAAQNGPSASQSNNNMSGHLLDFIGDNGALTSQGLSEISQLLSLYRDQWDSSSEFTNQTGTAGHLVDGLRTLAPNASAGHVSKKDEKRSEAMKQLSPKSQHTKKVKDLTKTRKVRSSSQSTDTSLTAQSEALDKSTSSGKARKKGLSLHLLEGSKDKNTGSGKPAGNKNSGGPAWK